MDKWPFRARACSRVLGVAFAIVGIVGFANADSDAPYVEVAHAAQVTEDRQLAAQKEMGALPGRHEPEDKCGTDPLDQRCGVWELAVDLLPDVPGLERVRVSASEGLALFDANNKLIARNEDGLSPGSLSAVGELSAGQVIPDADLELVWSYDDGGRNSGSSGVDVFKRRGTELVRVFTGDSREWQDVRAGGTEQTGKVTLSAKGVIRYRAPGTKRATTWHWDATAFRFVKEVSQSLHRFN